MIRPQRRLGEILKSQGLITEEQLQAALQEYTTNGEFLGIILLRHQAISAEALVNALAEQFGLPVIRLKERYLDFELVSEFSASLMFDHKVFPLSRETWSITVVILNPLDAWAIKKTEEAAFPLKVKIALTYPQDMEEALKRYRQYLKGTISPR